MVLWEIIRYDAAILLPIDTQRCLNDDLKRFQNLKLVDNGNYHSLEVSLTAKSISVLYIHLSLCANLKIAANQELSKVNGASY